MNKKELEELAKSRLEDITCLRDENEKLSKELADIKTATQMLTDQFNKLMRARTQLAQAKEESDSKIIRLEAEVKHLSSEAQKVTRLRDACAQAHKDLESQERKNVDARQEHLLREEHLEKDRDALGSMMREMTQEKAEILAEARIREEELLEANRMLGEEIRELEHLNSKFYSEPTTKSETRSCNSAHDDRRYIANLRDELVVAGEQLRRERQKHNSMLTGRDRVIEAMVEAGWITPARKHSFPGDTHFEPAAEKVTRSEPGFQELVDQIKAHLGGRESQSGLVSIEISCEDA